MAPEQTYYSPPRLPVSRNASRLTDAITGTHAFRLTPHACYNRNMNSEEYERMYRLEDSYWWFVGRHDLALSFLKAAFPGRTDLLILDVGCGTGAMSEKLAAYGAVVSADFSPLALAFSRRRHLDRLCAADAMRLPFRD